ncbi:MAG: yjlD [Firmicutes bacterium]|nr:yjlD [Bacillota bacterium]
MEKNPKVVVVGAGFAGLRAVKELADSGMEVTLIDKNNHHLFQPLLYQVATAGLAAEDIVYPLRAVLRKQKNLRFKMAEVLEVDKENRKVVTSNGDVSYDYLLLAPGAQSNYFGLESVEKNGLGLKDIKEAMVIRNHILKIFESAAQESDEQTRRAMLTFVIVGGGATGVECAGGLSELVYLVLAKDYPEIDFSEVRILLIEGSNRLLGAMPEELSQLAWQELKRKKIDVRLEARVTDYDGNTIHLGDGIKIECKTLIWGAGVRAADLTRRLGAATKSLSRVETNGYLQLPDYPEIFLVGDSAYFEQDGKPLPMVAPVAIQQAVVAAKNIKQLVKENPLQEFHYKDPGSMATIGRSAAVVNLGRWHFGGLIAWVLWLVVHLFQIIGFRNRILVVINWAWDYFLFERAVRVIDPEGKNRT